MGGTPCGMSILVAGGGIPRGQVVGSSNKNCAHPEPPLRGCAPLRSVTDTGRINSPGESSFLKPFRLRIVFSHTRESKTGCLTSSHCTILIGTAISHSKTVRSASALLDGEPRRPKSRLLPLRVTTDCPDDLRGGVRHDQFSSSPVDGRI